MRRNIKGIDQDNPEIQYKTGISLYRRKAYTEGLAWLEKSANQGYPVAMDALGMIFYNKGDFKKAFQYWSRAVDYGFPDAKNNLGWLYYSGEGVKQDLEKAYNLHAEAANSNCNDDNVKAEAAKMAAVMSYNGEGTEKSLDQATYWLKIASSLGMLSATILLQRFEEENLKMPVGRLVSIDNFKLQWEHQIPN